MPASGPYRSRLFNVLHRQTRQWAEQSTQVWRHLKVATLWSVQLLLYPVYWAFQTGRIVGKQLQQAERQVAHFRLQLAARRQPHPPLTVDTPIYNLLHTIQALLPTATVATAEPPSPSVLPPGSPPVTLEPIPFDATLLEGCGAIAGAPPATVDSRAADLAPTMTAGSATPLAKTSTRDTLPLPQGNQASPSVIRAIASWVDTRTLVLVTTQNQVLDILTPQQQQWLYQRLADEVASYRRYQQIAQTPQWQFQVRLFPPKLRQTQLPPVRYFRALMGWMQQGPVAKLTNLFDEATLLTGDRWDLANLLTLPALPTLADIDAAGQPRIAPALPPPSSWLGTLPQSASTLIQKLLHQAATHPPGSVAAIHEALPAGIAVDLQWEGPADLWAGAFPPQLGQGLLGNPPPVQGIPCPFPPTSPECLPAALPASAVPSIQPVRSTSLLRSVLRALNPETVSSAVVNVNSVDAAENTGRPPAPVSQWQAIVRLVWANSAAVPTPVQADQSPVMPARGMPNWPPRRVSSGEVSPVATAAVSPLMPPPVGPLPTATAGVTPVHGPLPATTPTTMGEARSTELTPAATAASAAPATTLLEVEAQIMGYVKHPLEHILEWLDQIMLWIETIVGRIWRWLQARLPQL